MNKFEREWILSLVKKDMMLKIPKEERIPTIVEPKTKIQVIIKEFFKRLKSSESVDALDQFYQEYIKDYKRQYAVAEFLNDVLKKIGLKSRYPVTEKEFEEVLFTIAERVKEESDGIETIENYINSIYPNLVSKYEGEVQEQYENEYNEYTTKELERIKEDTEFNRERFKDVIDRIKQAKLTDIEDLGEKLNKVVSIGSSVWEMLIYAIMSPYTPRIPIDNIYERSVMHTLLVGDISTAKTKIGKILERLSPNGERYTDFTPASFEGVMNLSDNTIDEGIIDRVSNGCLITSEFGKFIDKFKYLNEVLDDDEIHIVKRGATKRIRPNMVLIGATNPKFEFFRESIKLRSQVMLRETLLSRMDILLPLILTKEKNREIIHKRHIFSYGNDLIDLEKEGLKLNDLSMGMQEIEQIRPTQKQIEMIHNAFEKKNKDITNRPLITPRDEDTLIRFVSVISCINFPRRTVKDRVLYVKDEDVKKAIELWNDLIDLREQLYQKESRNLLTVEEKIFIEIKKSGKEGITAEELENIFVRETKDGRQIYDNNDNPLGICAKSTLYKKIKRLQQKKLIVKKGMRNFRLYAVV